MNVGPCLRNAGISSEQGASPVTPDGNAPTQNVFAFEDGNFRTSDQYGQIELELPWYGDVPISITRLNTFFEDSSTKTVEGMMENVEDLFDHLYQTNETTEEKCLNPVGTYTDNSCYEIEQVPIWGRCSNVVLTEVQEEFNPADPYDEDSDPSTITEKEFREQFRFQSGLTKESIDAWNKRCENYGQTCKIESSSESEDGFCPDEDFVSAVAESSSSSSDDEEIVVTKVVSRKLRPRRLPRSEAKRVQEDIDSTLGLSQNINKKAAWNRTLQAHDKYRPQVPYGPRILRKIELTDRQLRRLKLFYPYLCRGDFDLETMIKGFQAVCKLLWEQQWYKVFTDKDPKFDIKADIVRKLYYVISYNQLQRLDGKLRKPKPLHNQALFYWLANYKFLMHCFSDKKDDLFSTRWEIFYKDSETYEQMRSEIHFQGFGDWWTWAKNKVTGATASMAGVGSNIISDALKQTLAGIPAQIVQGLKDAATATVDWVKTMMAKLKKLLKDACDKVIEVLKCVFDSMFTSKILRNVMRHCCIALAMIIVFTIMHRYLVEESYRSLFFSLFCGVMALYGLYATAQTFEMYCGIWASTGGVWFQNMGTLKMIFGMVVSFFFPPNLGALANLTTKWNDFTSNLTDHFKWLVDNVYRVFTQTHFYPEFDEKDKFEEFVQKVTDLVTSVDVEDDAGFDAHKAREIVDMHTEALKQAVVLSKLFKSNSPAYIRISQLFARLKELKDKTLSQSVDVRDRITPFVIWLDGPPDQGKSDIAKLLPRAIYNNVRARLPKHFTREWNEAMLYTKPQSSDFWELYNPYNHFAVAIEELASTANPQERGKLFAEFLELVSTGAKPLDSAAIGGKGCTWFGSKLMIISTNIGDDEINSGGGITRPPAVFRRRHLKLFIEQDKYIPDEQERIKRRDEAWKMKLSACQEYRSALKWHPQLRDEVSKGVVTLRFNQVVKLAADQIVTRIVNRDKAALTRVEESFLVPNAPFFGSPKPSTSSSSSSDPSSSHSSDGSSDGDIIGPNENPGESMAEAVLASSSEETVVTDVPNPFARRVNEQRDEDKNEINTRTPEIRTFLTSLTHNHNAHETLLYNLHPYIASDVFLFSRPRFTFPYDNAVQQQFLEYMWSSNVGVIFGFINKKANELKKPSKHQRAQQTNIDLFHKKLQYLEQHPGCERYCDIYFAMIANGRFGPLFAGPRIDHYYMKIMRTEIFIEWLENGNLDESEKKYAVSEEVRFQLGKDELDKREAAVGLICGRFPPRFNEMNSWSIFGSRSDVPRLDDLIELLNPLEMNQYFQDMKYYNEVMDMQVATCQKVKQEFANIFHPDPDRRIHGYAFITTMVSAMRHKKCNPDYRVNIFPKIDGFYRIVTALTEQPAYRGHPLLMMIRYDTGHCKKEKLHWTSKFEDLGTEMQYVMKAFTQVCNLNCFDCMIKNHLCEAAKPLDYLKHEVFSESIIRTIIKDLEFHMEEKGATYYKLAGTFTVVAIALTGILSLWGIGMYYGITEVVQKLKGTGELVAQSLSRGVMVKLNKARTVRFQARKKRVKKFKDELGNKQEKVGVEKKKVEIKAGEIEKMSDKEFVKFQTKIETTIDHQINKIANNIKTFSFTYGNQAHLTYGLVSGYQVFITSHFFEVHGLNFDECMIMNEKVVQHRFAAKDIKIEKLEEGRDCTSLMLPKTYVPLPSLEKKMITQKDMDSFDGERYQIGRVHRSSKNGIVTIRYVLGNDLRKGKVREEQLTTPEGRKIRMKIDKYLVSVGSQGEDGDCSLPYCVFDRVTGHVKIVGFHFARLGEDSFVCPLLKSDLKYHNAFTSTNGVKFNAGLGNWNGEIKGCYIPDCVKKLGIRRRQPFDGRLTSLGEVKKPSFIPSQTNFIPSPFQGDAVLGPIEDIHCYPAVLHTTTFDDGQEPGTVYPLPQGLEKMTSPPVKLFPEELKEFAEKEPEKCFRGFCPQVRKTFKMKTLYEALELLSRDTSVGFDMKSLGFKSRTEMWKVDELTGKVTWVHPLVTAEVEKIFTAMKQGYMPRNDIEFCLKDEIRDEVRVRLGKTRIFCVGGFAHLVATIMVMGDVVLFIKENFATSDVAIGVNPHGKDWTLLIRKLLQFHKLGAGDFGNYDTSIVSEFAYLMYLCLRQYTLWYLEDPLLDWYLFCMCMSCVAPIAVICGEAYLMDWMNPSGNWMTGFFNSFVNNVIFNYFFEYLCQTKSLGSLVREDHLATWFYGDDNMWGVSELLSSHFTMKTLGEFIYEKFGMTYTTPSKKAIEVEFLDLTEIDFLCRRFQKWNPNDSLYHAPLAEDSIHQMLLWLRKPARGVSISDQMAINVDTALMEYYHYGEERFNVEQQKLYKYSRHFNIPWKAKEFAHYHRRFVDGVLHC